MAARGFTCHAPAPDTAAVPVEAPAVAATYRVRGLSCGYCAATAVRSVITEADYTPAD